MRGRPVPVRVRGLPHFDQVAVGITDVAAGLVLVLFRRGQELGAPGAPLGVHGLNVLDPDVEEAADPVGVAWRLQGDGRLVVGGTAPDVDDDPGIGQRDVGQPAGTGEGHPAAQYLGVEAPGALDIVRDDEVGQHNSLWRRRELSHLAPPLVGSHTLLTTGLQPMLLTASACRQARPGHGFRIARPAAASRPGESLAVPGSRDSPGRDQPFPGATVGA